MPEHGFKESIAARAYEEAGLGPDDLDCAEVYDLSTAMELDWYEQIGLCAPGEAEKLLRDGETTIGGRVPVNPSGGLACFGEAVPAQAIAQVCELTWQLQGRADGRQVEGARTSASRSTRASSATAPRSSSPASRRTGVSCTHMRRYCTPVRAVRARSASYEVGEASSTTCVGGLGDGAAVERRLRVVLDAELDRLRDLVAGDVRGERAAPCRCPTTRRPR